MSIMEQTAIRDRLKRLHDQENELNKEMSKIDYQIKMLRKQKEKVAKRVSNNMRYRNKLINQL